MLLPFAFDSRYTEWAWCSLIFEALVPDITNTIENFFFCVLSSKFTDTIRQGFKFDFIFISNGVNTDITCLM